jgi:hypothetical protein
MFKLNEFYRAMYFNVEATKLAKHCFSLITFTVNLSNFYFYRNSATKIIKYNTIISSSIFPGCATHDHRLKICGHDILLKGIILLIFIIFHELQLLFMNFL